MQGGAQGPHQRAGFGVRCYGRHRRFYLYFRIMTEEHSGRGVTSQAGIIAGQELLVHNLTTRSVGPSFARVQMGLWRPEQGSFVQSLRTLWTLLHLPTAQPPVLRCLGIPTRVVTNYYSAHDQNSNLLIEYFRNEFGELESGKSEMIW